LAHISVLTAADPCCVTRLREAALLEPSGDYKDCCSSGFRCRIQWVLYMPSSFYSGRTNIFCHTLDCWSWRRVGVFPLFSQSL